MDIVFYLITTVVPLLVKLFFIALAVFLAVLLARTIRKFSVDRLRYERYCADECVYEGDSTELVETIWNPTLFFVPLVDVGSYFYDGLAVDGKKPDGMCDSAWESMAYFVRTLAEGGGNFYDGWMKNPYSAMISCNDGFRPVSFLIEAIE